MKFINYNLIAMFLLTASAQAAGMDLANDFKDIDADNDGYITESELLTYQQNGSEEQNKQVFQAIDADNDGIIREEEFTAFYKKTGMDQEWAADNLQSRFAEIDSDGNKEITPEEMTAFRTKSIAPENKALFEAMDANSDGKINSKEFDEFFSLLSQLTGF